MMKFPKEVCDSNPLDGLVGLPSSDSAVHAVISTLVSALPNTSTVALLDLGLGPLFVQQIWEDMGEVGDANASAAIHHALTRDPGCPGLSHFSRAVLALTLCARWGGGLGPVDQPLRSGLQILVGEVDPDAIFWAEYIGAVAAAITRVVPCRPTSAERLTDTLRFQASIDNSGEVTKYMLTLTVNSEAMKGIDLQDLADLFKHVGKTKNQHVGKTKKTDAKRTKVKLQIQQVSSL